jgi:hypothetical protein
MVGLRSVIAVSTTGVAYENRLFLDPVSSLAMGGAWIDSVLVV